MNPPDFCGRAFRKCAYFRRGEPAQDWISAASSMPVLQVPCPCILLAGAGSESRQPGYGQRDVPPAPAPMASVRPFGIPRALSQLLEDCATGWVGWTMHPNMVRGLPAPGAVEPKLRREGR